MVLYARPTDVLTAGATWSVVSGAAAAAYPVSNLGLLASYRVVRSTGTSLTVRATFGAPVTLQALLFVNTNASAVQLTNGAGLNVAVTIPALPLDGAPLDPWVDLRETANTSSTTWDIALTGPSGVALGTPVLIQTLRQMPLLWRGLGEDEQHGAIVDRTDYGVLLALDLDVRQRAIRGRLIRESFRDDLLALVRSAKGQVLPFPIILDPSGDEGLYVHFEDETIEAVRIAPVATEVDLAFTEQQKGWL